MTHVRSMSDHKYRIISQFPYVDSLLPLERIPCSTKWSYVHTINTELFNSFYESYINIYLDDILTNYLHAHHILAYNPFHGRHRERFYSYLPETDARHPTFKNNTAPNHSQTTIIICLTHVTHSLSLFTNPYRGLVKTNYEKHVTSAHYQKNAQSTECDPEFPLDLILPSISFHSAKSHKCITHFSMWFNHSASTT